MSTNYDTVRGVHLGKFWYQGETKGEAWIWQIGPDGLADTVDGVRAALADEPEVVDEYGNHVPTEGFLRWVDACTRIDAEEDEFC